MHRCTNGETLTRERETQIGIRIVFVQGIYCAGLLTWTMEYWGSTRRAMPSMTLKARRIRAKYEGICSAAQVIYSKPVPT